MTSGGSAFKMLDYININNFNEKTTITVLDERFSNDPTINNFAQLTTTCFYQDSKKAGCSFIDTRVKNNEKIEELTKRFERSLKNWRRTNNNGVIIATLGIGPDGHCAGIMPYPDDLLLFKHLFEGEAWVSCYDAKNKNPYPLRVTTTITFIKQQINFALCYVAGEEKKHVLGKVFSHRFKLNEVPAKVITEIKNIELFTDSKLDKK